MNTESQTPRTDAFFAQPEIKKGGANSRFHALDEYARTLERELAAKSAALETALLMQSKANEKIATLRAALECVTGTAGRGEVTLTPTIHQWIGIVNQARAALAQVTP
jgi:hypothetical protein